EPAGEGSHVQHRAAYQQRQPAACDDLGAEPTRIGGEARRRVGLGRSETVAEAVRGGREPGRPGLGGADGHAAVARQRGGQGSSSDGCSSDRSPLVKALTYSIVPRTSSGSRLRATFSAQSRRASAAKRAAE